MDTNDYALARSAEDRLADARARADRRWLLASAPRRPGLRERVGVALIRLGQRVQGYAVDPTPRTAAALHP